MNTTSKEKYNRPKKSEDDLNISREEQDRLFSYWGNKKDEALKRGSTRPVKTWFMFRFIIGTGLRATEACNVQIKDLNLDTKTPNVVVRNGKGNKRRTVYIATTLVNDIKWYLNYKRKSLNHTTAYPCNGYVDCNVNVDAADVDKFLEDFGRSQFNNPCPPCVAGDWCVYP